jgi:predicted  nucleic acid-binding Zn-ribbon protein
MNKEQIIKLLTYVELDIQTITLKGKAAREAVETAFKEVQRKKDEVAAAEAHAMSLKEAVTECKLQYAALSEQQLYLKERLEELQQMEVAQ